MSESTIMNLQHCGDTIAVAAADPAFGLVHDNGQVKPWQTSVAADMRGKHSNGAFTLAANASAVRFGLGYGLEDPVLFDLAQATVNECA